jgi:hypothetical protein
MYAATTIRAFCLILVSVMFALTSFAVMPDPALIGPKTEPVNLSDYKQVYHVSANTGNDEQGDGTRDKPWKSVVHALDSISSASEASPAAVLVAEGLYDQNTIVMKAYVSLLGGYAKDTWERAIDQYKSILSGAEVRRVVICADNARLDGFHITAGRSLGHGAGILCEDTSPTISNNVITGNWTLEPPDFNHHRIHQPGYDGGGIACLFNARPVIHNNVIADNGTGVGKGAGISFQGRAYPTATPVAEFRHNVVVNNVSGRSDSNQTRSSSGGGISCAHETSPKIEENIIVGNQSLGLSDTGGIYCEYAASPAISSNWIVGNRGADDGGGIYIMRLSEPTVDNNIVAGNASRGVGGVRISKEGRALINSNLIARNLSGGGVLVRDGYVFLAKNLIVDNQGGVGFEYRQDYAYFVAPSLEGDVIWGNEQPGISVVGKSVKPPIVRNCVVEGGYEGEGNSAADPHLVKDGGTGTISSLSYSAEAHTTTLKGQVPDCAAAGRVLFLGNQASVVKSRDANAVTVWGRLTQEQDGRSVGTFDVMSTYGFR